MGKKSAPKAPAAPDPVATANAQAAANTTAAITQANLNRIDQITPQGSIKYTQSGTNSDGTPKYTQTQAFSPEQQNLYNQQVQVDSGLNQLAVNNLDRVAQAQSKPFTFDGMTPTATVQSNAGQLQYGTAASPFKSSVDSAGPLTTNVQGGPIQGSLDYSKVSALPDGSSFNDTSKAAADAVYNQAASRLDPQYAQLEASERNRLINSGISENSAAYRQAMDNFGRSRNDAYNQANYSSIGAGLAAQNQGYNQALSTRQQGVNEVNTQGQFANAAQSLGFNQGVTNADLNNTAQQQQFAQNSAQTDAFNNAQQNQFAQSQANLASNNTAVGQAFNQSLGAANQNNSVRQQQIQEASYLRNLPINDIAALLGTGGQVANPEFQNVAQVGVAAPDYQGAVQSNYNAQMQQYNQQMAARSQGLGSIFGLAGSLGSAAILSDRRLKHTITRIGELSNGIATYVYSYLGSTKRHFGVMAQEVAERIPDAVGKFADGTMFVDYRKVW